MEDQLQAAGGVAANLAARDLAIVGHAHFVGHVFVGELLFGLADEADLRDGVNAVGIDSWDWRCMRVVAEGAGGGDAALLHRDRGQAGKADHVADGEDVRHLGAEVLVDGDAAARVGFDAGGGQIQIVDVALAADRVEQRVAGDLLLAFQIRDHGAVGQLFHAFHFFVQAHGHAAVAQVVAERLDDFLVGEFEQPWAAFRSG